MLILLLAGAILLTSVVIWMGCIIKKQLEEETSVMED